MAIRQQPSLKGKILSMLARREHSRAELEQKTLAWMLRQEARKNTKEDGSRPLWGSSRQEPTKEQIDEVRTILDEFESNGWVSDERYVESLFNQKAHRLGSTRLRQELREKGVCDELAQTALEEIKDTEYERACDVWQRKYKKPPEDAKEYGKQVRFMTYRGFSPELVRRVLQNSGVDEESQ